MTEQDDFFSHLSQQQLMVVGDVMLDRYWYGDTHRISPEAPVPVVNIEHTQDRAGGAANVALNLRALGVTTQLIGAIGQDTTGEQLQALLTAQQVQCHFIRDPQMTTITKLRVLGRHQQLIRLDFEQPDPGVGQAIEQQAMGLLDPNKVLILSDYAKGALLAPQGLIKAAKAKGIKVLVDPKSRDLSIYQGADVITPNIHEFEAAVGPCNSDSVLISQGQKLLQQFNFAAILITRGNQGMLLIEPHSTLAIPAQAREVFDITGAGDTVIAVMGALLASGENLANAAKVANLAAGIAVGKIGTAQITQAELADSWASLPRQGSQHKIVTLPKLLNELPKAKCCGESIVMTNGCFDVLHAGHVQYLEQAKALGARLIVAINDDLSVSRLKGASRPINSLAQRMQVLAGLGCVDWVIAFSQDTPEQLIAELLPDILVKGGDYTPETIAGAQQILKHGGQVKILDFIPGCSTTGILQRAQMQAVPVTQHSMEIEP